jgi:hypothetical protein
MANWAKGLAAGLDTGYKLGEMYQKGAERRALQEAATATPEQFQGYTPEQGAQLEAAAKSGLYDIGTKMDEQGNFQGYTVTPKASPEMQGLMAPGQVSQMYGQRYEGTLAPEQIQGLRMGRMADVVAETDPIRAQQLRAQQAEQEFQAKYRPMQLESTQLGLEEARRKGAGAEARAAWDKWYSENPNASYTDAFAQARQLGVSVDDQFKIASGITGVEEGKFKASQARIKNLLQGQGLDGLLKSHRESDDLDPGSHFEKTIGKDGRITLNRVDSATGKVIQPNVFTGKEAEVVGYLNKVALDPATIVDYTMAIEKNAMENRKGEALIRHYDAATAKDQAYGQGLRATNLIDVQKPDGSVTRIDQSKYMKDGELQLPAGYKLIKAEHTAMQMPPALKTRYDELVKSDRWERAKTADQKIMLLEQEGIPPSAVGLRSPTDDLIALMKQNQGGTPQSVVRKPLQQATPAGQQLLGLAGELLPPQPTPATLPTTSAERMRGLYLPPR